MVRKILIIASALFFLAAPILTRAQTTTPSATPTPTEAPFNFEKAYKDYVFTLDVYNKLHSEYQLAKSQYMQANTLASNAKAREATAAMLVGRDDVMIVYLGVLNQRLVEAIGISETTKNGLTNRMNTEITWYRNHKGKISSAATLEDLTDDSKEAADHYALTEPLIYEVLASVPTGKISDTRRMFNDLLGLLKQKTSSIRLAGDHDTTLAERWISETENKLTRSIDKEVEAQTLLLTITNSDKRTRNVNNGETYNQIIFRLDESMLFLKEASGYTKEVLKQLKTKN